jgi:hypothetical protein
VPAILHLFILFYYFHLSMFERFINCIVSFLLCVFYDTILMHAHPGLPSRCVSRLYPAGTRHLFLSIIFGTILPSVQSYLRSYLTFGTILTFGPILPRILEQVLCPRYSISRSSRYYTFSLLFFFFPNIT